MKNYSHLCIKRWCGQASHLTMNFLQSLKKKMVLNSSTHHYRLSSGNSFDPLSTPSSHGNHLRCHTFDCQLQITFGRLLLIVTGILNHLRKKREMLNPLPLLNWRSQLNFKQDYSHSSFKHTSSVILNFL